MMCSIDKTIPFCWISNFFEVPPDTQFVTTFSPPGIHSLFLRVASKVLQFQNLESRNGTFSLTDWGFIKYVFTPVISLLENSNNCLGVTICSEVCKLARAVNLFNVPPTPSQAGKTEHLCLNSFILKNRAA